MHTSTLAVAGGGMGGVRHVWAALLVPPSTLFSCDSADGLAKPRGSVAKAVLPEEE